MDERIYFGLSGAISTVDVLNYEGALGLNVMDGVTDTTPLVEDIIRESWQHLAEQGYSTALRGNPRATHMVKQHTVEYGADLQPVATSEATYYSLGYMGQRDFVPYATLLPQHTD